MQPNNIIEKAKKLGLDIGNGSTSAENLSYIADQVGADDLNSLNSRLDDMLSSQNEETKENPTDYVESLADSENLDPQEQRQPFGKKEYDAAKNENGVYDKNYYANRQKELDENVEKAKEEKGNKQKEVEKKNDKGEKVPTQAKAKAYNAMHPGEALKDKLKEKTIGKAKNGAKNVAKKAGKKAGKAAKKATKAAAKAAAKLAKTAASALLKLIMSNPYVALAVLIIVLVVFLILIIFAGTSSIGDDSNGYGAVCDAMSIKSTSLSKYEFIGKVEEYFGDSTSTSALAFKQNAGSIYDIAINNNVNPELVVVRAIKEGFSPGGNTNNYWGMACYNTNPDACDNYETFDEAVLDFVMNVSQYTTASAMMQKYAYIGSYWYNPGSSSEGGCYYYPYIKEYLSESRKDEVENICSSHNTCDISGNGTCSPTTEEDQKAYAKWQVMTMAEIRQLVFDIEPDACKYNGDCVIYAQGDSRWGSINLGDSNSTMGGSGCAVTSIAIGISCSGAELNVSDFDAGVFIETLNDGNCFTSDGDIYWGCSAMKNILETMTFITSVNTKNFSNQQKNEIINSYDPNNHFILMHFKNNAHPRGHYVVYTETLGDYYITKDPAGGIITNQLISEIDQMVIYGF